MNLLHYTHQGLGHESLSLFLILRKSLSVLDPASRRSQARASFRLSRPHAVQKN